MLCLRQKGPKFGIKPNLFNIEESSRVVLLISSTDDTDWIYFCWQILYISKPRLTLSVRDYMDQW